MSDLETVQGEGGAPHVSVLLDEVVDALASGPGDMVIDGTFGAGGYTRAILAHGRVGHRFRPRPERRRASPLKFPRRMVAFG